MHVNNITYSLLCENCNGREPDSFIVVRSSQSFVNYSRQALISECHGILRKRPCSNCGIKGEYAIWAIYCGERPKQIHIQIIKNNDNFEVDIWNENHNCLNERLEQLPISDPLCQLLSRALVQITLRTLTT